MKINVNTNFDAGSIEIVDVSTTKQLVFKIKKDTNSNFYQWFYFQLNNVFNQDLNIVIKDLQDAAYPLGFANYKICVSYDNSNWFRLDTKFNGKDLRFKIKSQHNTIYFAYFEPYSYARHNKLIAQANSSLTFNHTVLGQTAQGKSIDLLSAGKINNKFKIWIIARQHPGETMAEWFMEGLIHKLLDNADAVSKKLLQQCVFYLVPNMNPDGAILGNLRVNSKGINLNREWLKPTIANSPEVYYVRKKIQATGVHMFFDIHGDESKPYIFSAGCSDNHSFSAKQKKLENEFESCFELANPDFQTVEGYERNSFKTETPNMATSWVGDHFNCLAQTIEMPFKDNANLPDSLYGWNGRRSYLLGQSLLIAINYMIQKFDKNLLKE
ncbi:MAG: M14-type cytosolic carboxypeptidase [Burkholderiales bacterium]|nr:M14-type cytosolic carboxypeptidase [Burkholderiales bacterium]